MNLAAIIQAILALIGTAISILELTKDVLMMIVARAGVAYAC